MYIALEGVVGVGKTTQMQLLIDRLTQSTGREVIHVREPGGTEIAEAVRTLVQATEFAETMHPITDAYLYATARAQLIHAKILPARARGAIIISDRSVVSSLAYQGVGQGFGIQNVWKINESAVSGCLPDQIIFFDLDIQTGLERAFDPEGDKRERLDQSFFERAYQGYQDCFEFEPIADRMMRLDASGSVEEVFERMKEIVNKNLSQ